MSLTLHEEPLELCPGLQRTGQRSWGCCLSRAKMREPWIWVHPLLRILFSLSTLRLQSGESGCGCSGELFSSLIDLLQLEACVSDSVLNQAKPFRHGFTEGTLYI